MRRRNPPRATREAVASAQGPQAEVALTHALKLLDEVRRQRDQLEVQVEAQRRQLDAAETERAELRRLVAMAFQAKPALPAPGDQAMSLPSVVATPTARGRPAGYRGSLVRWLRDWLGL